MGLKSCDGNQELLNFLRSDLIEVATRLQKGGLGYIEGTSEFEARVRGPERTHESCWYRSSAWSHFLSWCLMFGFVLHICGTKSLCNFCCCYLFCLLSIYQKMGQIQFFLLLTLGYFSLRLALFHQAGFTMWP